MATPKGPGMSGPWAYGALGVGVLLVLVFAVWNEVADGSFVYLVPATYGFVLSCVGASRMPSARRRIWWALAAGQGLFLAGDLLWTLFEDVLGIQPYPSVADVAYLLSYPAVALGIMWLVRGRRRGRDRAAFLDAAILTTGFTVVGAVFFVQPAAASGGTTTLDQLVAAAYPAADLLVLALLIRMLTSGTVRNVSLWGLVAGVAALLLMDLWYVMSVVSDAAYPAWIDNGYLLSYVLIGFAAVHPSAHSLSEPAPERPERITAARLVVLGAALMLAPTTEQLSHLLYPDRSTGAWVVLVGGVLSALFVVLRMWDLVTALQRKAVQLAALARKDPLTGVANRRTWDHELSRACAFAREQGTPLSVAVLDMDNFKLFNDAHGHVLGDLVLKETAALWASILHGRGFVARYGGEEFAVLLPNTPATAAEAVLERMRRTMSHDQSCSIGLAEWDGVESPAEVFARADEALYHAKHHGRDRIAMHDGRSSVVIDAGAGDGAHPGASVRAVYQPIVDLSTGETVAFEALSRFQGRDPVEVFATATRQGAGPALEAAAIREALAGWDRPEPLSLNTSLTSLLSPEVQQELPTDLSRIIIEITEGDLVDYSPEMMLMLDGMRARGVRIAIDDLGVGFSNVERVVTIDPDIIKIDMSLIRSVDANPMLQAVIASCVVFARKTGAQLVAEGVETAQERDYLHRAGVPLAQGYLLGRPEPRPAAEDALTLS
ncbi:MAG TPA: GGDEF and EAL domain-containing protein [Nocardioides sp.]|nr:GGDEF and EAL domain-containing protein [Nocardioides sp.]